ncbi:unnamed protein product, partial [Ectocarpus sp. 12 AP-2014]
MSEDKQQKLQENSTEEKTTAQAIESKVEETVDDSTNSTVQPEENVPESNESAVETDVMNEIDDSNAEDAEDSDTEKRHEIPMPDYHEMNMENLVGELQRLVKNEKVQAIRKHVDNIKDEFNQKFDEFIEEKKEEFIANGGNEIDFRYNSVDKRQFNEVYT